MFRLELLQLLELPSEDREVGITISIDKMHLIKIRVVREDVNGVNHTFLDKV